MEENKGEYKCQICGMKTNVNKSAREHAKKCGVVRKIMSKFKSHQQQQISTNNYDKMEVDEVKAYVEKQIMHFTID